MKKVLFLVVVFLLLSPTTWGRESRCKQQLIVGHWGPSFLSEQDLSEISSLPWVGLDFIKLFNDLKKLEVDYRGLPVSGARFIDEAYMLFHDFRFQNSSGLPVQSRLGFFRKHSRNEILVVVAFYSANGLVGFGIRSVWHDLSNDLALEFEGLMTREGFSETRGIRFPFYERSYALARKLGLKKITTLADWRGRELWAQEGFQFDGAKAFSYNGRLMTSLQLSRVNFSNFLKERGIKIKDLLIVSEEGARRVKSLRDFKTPLDFLQAQHVSGQKVLVRPLLSSDSNGFVYSEPTAYDVGRAFVLSDYVRRPDQINSVIPVEYPDEALSDQAMPFWYGQQQRRR
ncbi:MAG: hypothetical protein H6626_03965 [Pseudobdellovibrionaceae bacterium]|nr:MAG: hypothetical protein H6626_03965 [Pseudobdellovibrionaceae bacterium]